MSYKEQISTIASFYEQRKKQFNPHEDFYYVVPMFPYPSGKIHMGHIRNYSISNVVAQYHKYTGKQVFHPIGFDSFGMPAENAAIKNHVSPAQWTENNIAQMSEDFKRSGFDFDWSHSIQTHQFDYYKFEQDIFKKAWTEGLIYKKEQYVNYDPVDNTVLSNEQVVNGLGWRTGAKVVRKKIPMFYFDMKRYAKRLHDDLSQCTQWPKRVIDMQKNWIGYELGDNHRYHFSFGIVDIFKSQKIKDSDIYSVIIGINHPCVEFFQSQDDFQKWTESATEGGVSQKENFAKKIQYYTGCFIDMEPRPIPVVIDMNVDDEIIFSKQKTNFQTQTHDEKGVFEQQESATFIGLKDWCISRQRYWGNPIPMIDCEHCGDVLSLDYVRLPTDMIPNGQGNVLNTNENFIHCICPQCGKEAKRYTDTMDTFVQSSWYFHRYISPHSERMIEFADTQIDHYIGGIEHATMHLIYTRFFHKMLFDFGMVSTIEPIKKLTTQGMVCKKYVKEDGTIASSKMSKSIGNIVEPKTYIEQYGADALQMFMIFAAPPEQNFDFEDDGIIGSFRFLDEIYQYFFQENKAVKNISQEQCVQIIQKTQQYIQKEFEGRFNINTVVPQLMVCFRQMKKTDFTDPEIQSQCEKAFIKMLAIIAPQISFYIQQHVFKYKHTAKMKC